MGQQEKLPDGGSFAERIMPFDVNIHFAANRFQRIGCEMIGFSGNLQRINKAADGSFNAVNFQCMEIQPITNGAL